MALKSDRNIVDWDLAYYCDTTASKGMLAFHTTNTGPSPSGGFMDQGEAVVTFPANPSGHTPLGFLLDDVVNQDLTQQHLDHNRAVVQVGSKVSIATRGWLCTDKIQGTPSGGMLCLPGGTGHVTTDGHVNGVAASGLVAVGRFMGAKDADGFAKVSFNLP